MPDRLPIAQCGGCQRAIVGSGFFGVEIHEKPHCQICRSRAIGPEAARFADTELERLAAVLATLPRGRQRQTAARMLYDAAGALLTAHGMPTRAAVDVR